MYLHYVLQEIADGKLAPLELDALPTGLNAYYCRSWQRWRDDPRTGGRDRWKAFYKPLLCALAAAQEPVDASRLAAWCGLGGREDEIKELLEQAWRGFVTYQRRATAAGEVVRYQFLHPSLTRFVRGEAGEPSAHNTGGLSEQEMRFVRELKEGVQAAHRNIVAAMEAQCGGDWPRLAEADDYVRRYLSAHLDAVDPALLYRIAAQDDRWAKAREAKEEGYTGYLNDLRIVRQRADAAGWAGLGRGIRCALIESSIRALAGNVPPRLLGQLVQAGLWSGLRALETARQVPDDEQKSEALAQIAPHLDADLHGEALAAARAIGAEGSRADALRDLAPHLSEPLRAEVLQEALAAARAIGDEWGRASALRDLAPHLSEPLRAEVLQEALAAARAIGAKGSRADALRDLAPHLSEPERNEVFVRLAQLARSHSNYFEPLMEVWQAGRFAGLTFEAWQKVLTAFASRPRSECVQSLVAVLPLIAHQGGQAAVDEFWAALRDVWRWWP
ncbi:MAG: hypothetical protein KatS3mg053_1851 [Candidatus Roseilinea sp.]|nr:MAG: hypothetical protein KatS3mg053_1851 [Candidatus Roseilinea sp.]